MEYGYLCIIEHQTISTLNNDVPVYFDRIIFQQKVSKICQACKQRIAEFVSIFSLFFRFNYVAVGAGESVFIGF